MIYGDSGVGKTLLAGTAAYVEELSPIIFIDVEGGSLSLNHFDDTADIDVVRVEKWQDMQKVYDELYKGKHPYKTVVIDSLTEMQQMAMASVLGAGTTLDAVGHLPEYKDWNINTQQMRRLVRAFRDLPMNSVFTCLSVDRQDPQRENVYHKLPALTNKLSKEIPAFFDILFFMSVDTRNGKNRRFVQTDKSATIVAKCRVQGVPFEIENPTMNTLYDMLIRNPNRLEGKDGLPVVQEAQQTATRGGMAKRK